MPTAGLQNKLRLLFGLAEKLRKRTSSAKNWLLTKLTAKCTAKSVNHLSQGKRGKFSSQQLLIKPRQYVGNCKSAQAELIIISTVFSDNYQKKMHDVVHKCDSVQFRGLNGLPLSRAFLASRKNFRRFHG